MKFRQMLTLSLSLLTTIAYAKPIKDIVEPIVDHYSPNAHVGIVIMDANTGETLYAKNPYHYFQPASATKLVTAYSGLALLGPKFRYTTALKAKNQAITQNTLTGPLYLEFSGDPSLTRGDLAQLIHSLKGLGIKTIQGDLLIDNTTFSGPDRPTGTTLEDINWWYAAPVNSIIINKNVAAVAFKAADHLGAPPVIASSKNGTALTIDNHMKTQTQTQSKLCPMQIEVDDNNVAHFSGYYPIDLRESYERVALKNLVIPVTAIVQDQLKRDGITLTGQIRVGEAPAGTRVIATHESKPLIKLLERMLGRSDNLYADSLLKTLGVKRYQIGSYDAGVASEKATLKEHTNLDVDRMKLTDGCGMDALITPMQFSKLLFQVYQDSKMYRYFKKTLPLNGVRGTLRNRLTGKHIIKHVYAKTGTKRDVSALSGFLIGPRGKRYIFTIISNNNNHGTRAAHQMENSILDGLMRQG